MHDAGIVAIATVNSGRDESAAQTMSPRRIPQVFKPISDVADLGAEIAVRERCAARNVDRGRRGLALAEQRESVRDRFGRFVHGFAIRHVPGRLIVL